MVMIALLFQDLCCTANRILQLYVAVSACFCQWQTATTDIILPRNCCTKPPHIAHQVCFALMGSPTSGGTRQDLQRYPQPPRERKPSNIHLIAMLHGHRRILLSGYPLELTLECMQISTPLFPCCNCFKMQYASNSPIPDKSARTRHNRQSPTPQKQQQCLSWIGNAWYSVGMQLCCGFAILLER